MAKSTIAKVLKDNGIRPAPERPSSWRAFLKAHWGEIAGMDFFTTEVWTPTGLRTYYILFLIDLETRMVRVAGITPHPNGAFMAQVARNLTDAFDGFLRHHRLVICDRDSSFTAEFRRMLASAGAAWSRHPGRPPTAMRTRNASFSRSSPSAWNG